MQPKEPAYNNQDLLQDLDDAMMFREATRGQRFGNYLVDRIVAFAVGALLMFFAGMFLFALEGSGDGGLLLALLFYTGYIAYYTLMEGLNGGRTVGKLVTGTFALKNNGRALTMQDAFLRSLCRLIPFEVFSGLGNSPWHDQLTNTTVGQK